MREEYWPDLESLHLVNVHLDHLKRPFDAMDQAIRE